MLDHYREFGVQVELQARSTLFMVLIYEAFRSADMETIVIEDYPCKPLAWSLSL